MRIKLILPINHSGLNAATREEIATVLAPDTEVDIVNLTEGPEFIENRYDDSTAVQGVLCIGRQAEQEGYDGILVSCFTDPGVEVLKEIVSIPVLGAFVPSLLTANAITNQYAIITAVPEVVPIYLQHTRSLGHERNVVAIRHVNLPVQEMENRERLLEGLVHEGIETVKMGARAVILGCTGMLGVSRTLKERLRNHFKNHIPVIDPVPAGICMLQGLIRQRINV